MKGRLSVAIAWLGGKIGHFAWLLPISFYVAVVGVVKLIRWFDPTAGICDAGIWQSALVSHVLVLACLISTILIIRFSFPSKFDYLIKGGSAEDFKNLTAWERQKAAYYLLSLFFLSLLALIYKLI